MSDQVRAALELLLRDIRFVAHDEPPERMIPTQHRAGDIRQARAALPAATPGEPARCTCDIRGRQGSGQRVDPNPRCPVHARPIPTTETVERVAEAIWRGLRDQHLPVFPWSEFPDYEKPHYRRAARAALRAMGEG